MTWNVTNLKPRIGAMIETDLPALLSGQHADEIHRLLEDRGVLVIRGIDFDDESQLAFTETLGRHGDHDVGNIYKVSFDKAENPTHADYNYGNFAWHIDRTDIDLPPYVTMLCAKRLAGEGGQTEFANTHAAYDDLPDGDKALIEDLRVIHEVEAAIGAVVTQPTPEQLAAWRSHEPKVHPLVWRHRSGRRSLITSTSGCKVVGMEDAQGKALLARMMAFATQPQYTYRHEWQLGDLVLWNNTGTMHRAVPYDTACGRLMHRTVVEGHEPFDTGAPAPGRAPLAA